MNIFAKGTKILGVGFLFTAAFAVSAQLASTQLDGLLINCTAIYTFGDVRDLGCSLHLEFLESKVDRASRLSRVKVIRAEDDTGMDLVRTNQHSFHDDDDPIIAGGILQTIRGLKAPAPNAKAIRQLEAEVSLLTPTADTPVLTNFMSQPGQILHQSLLDQYQIAIRYRGETHDPYPPGSLVIDSSAGKTISLAIDDPQQKLVGLAFQRADGEPLVSGNIKQGINGSHTEFTCRFEQAPPTNLNLLVYVDTPKTAEKVRFRLENIRLPWVEAPDLEVSSKPATVHPYASSNLASCILFLNFTGGPLTNALGIRKLWIKQATDEAGREVKLGYANWRFDALSPVMGEGRNVRKWAPLIFQSRDPRSIRLMEGGAELVLPNATNDGRVVIKDIMNHAGESFDLPALRQNRVKLAYLGPVNYAAKRQEFVQRNGASERGGSLPKELPADTTNSLEFSLDDSENPVVVPFGGEEITLLDSQGRFQPAVNVMTSGNFLVYRFKTLPPPGTQLVLYLAVPESLAQVPFRIENIPLNQPSPRKFY